MARALALHYRSLGSNPEVDAIRGFSLLLVLVLDASVFHQVIRFPLSSKTYRSLFMNLNI